MLSRLSHGWVFYVWLLLYLFLLRNSFVKHQHLHGNIYANDSKSTRCLSKAELIPAEGERKQVSVYSVHSVFLLKMSAIILKSHQLHGFVLFKCPLNKSWFWTSIKLGKKHNENLSVCLGIWVQPLVVVRSLSFSTLSVSNKCLTNCRIQYNNRTNVYALATSKWCACLLFSPIPGSSSIVNAILNEN